MIKKTLKQNLKNSYQYMNKLKLLKFDKLKLLKTDKLKLLKIDVKVLK